MHSAPLRLLRIAILCCDEPVGETKKRYGGFGNLFRELFEKAARQVVQEGSHEPLKLNISTYDVLNGRTFPRLEDIDAVVLTGSSKSEIHRGYAICVLMDWASGYDSYSAGTNGWILRLVKFIEQVLYEQSRVRVIGVCFGHQIIGRALGVMPARSNSGWEVSVTEVELTATGRQLFGTELLVSCNISIGSVAGGLTVWDDAGHPPDAPRRTAQLSC